MSQAANVSGGADAVAGAFGEGLSYFMASNAERKEIAANATTLQDDEWRTVSDRMVEIYRGDLVGINDLMDAGLTRDISLATKVDLWQTMSQMTGAEVSMDGETESEEDRGTGQTEGVPVPIVHKDFRISERDLLTSRNLGNDLRTDMVADATRAVSETLEDILFHGWSPQIRDGRDSFELYGYTSHPNRNTVSASEEWSRSGTGAEAIRETLVTALDELDKDDRAGGEFWVYLAPEEWRVFRSAIDPDGDGNLTVRERFENEFDTEIASVQRSDRLDEGTGVMVDPRQDVVELAVAEDVQTVEWQSGSGMTNHFKVMGAMAPEIKADSTGQSGVVEMTGL
jgi:uncharacterized linocin/CFP29 family protein